MKEDKEKKQATELNEKVDLTEILEKNKKVTTNSDKLKKRDTKIKILRTGLLISLLFLIIIYFLLRLWYSNGGFTIGIDRGFAKKTGIVLFEKINEKNYKIQLDAGKMDYVDNISVNWLPKDIDNEAEGTHNGQNYLAYTFYVENMGSDAVNYWYTIYVDDVIKNLDKAIRIMVFKNGEKVIYAKQASNGENEKDTTKFYADNIVTINQVKDFKPEQADKFTIVVWIEGDDPDCVDALLGGEVKMHMEITEEQINNSSNSNTNND